MNMRVEDYMSDQKPVKLLNKVGLIPEISFDNSEMEAPTNYETLI
jgi:hypothetical protein